MHWNYAATTSRRSTGESAYQTKVLDAGSWAKSGGGYWAFPHGHMCLWTWAANPEDRPLWGQVERLKETFDADLYVGVNELTGDRFFLPMRRATRAPA